MLSRQVLGYMSSRIQTTRSGTIDGELEIKVAAETQVAGPGCAVVVPPDTVH